MIKINLIIRLTIIILEHIVTFLLGVILTNIRTVELLFQSLIKFRTDIRFSISYLYQIKINGKYLLIKGSNIDQYQPIGGVYKYKESFQSKISKWNIRFEDSTGFHESGDLRFFVKGKHVKDVVNWFDSRKNREAKIYREFYEELIENDTLTLDSLISTKFEYLKNKKTKIKYSTHFQSDEILIYDIFKVSLSKKDEDKIKKEIERNNELVLVSPKDIERRHYKVNRKDKPIGKHTEYIL